jgi:hypothetical protein
MQQRHVGPETLERACTQQGNDGGAFPLEVGDVLLEERCQVRLINDYRAAIGKPGSQRKDRLASCGQRKGLR